MAAAASSSNVIGINRDEEEEILDGLKTYYSYNTSLHNLDLSRLDLRNRDQLKSLLESGKKISILIVGKTGTGKSSLVNGLFGERIAAEGIGFSTAGTTRHVTAYSTRVKNVEIIIYDSPGLQDGSNLEDAYLREMKEKCVNFDLLIFALRITDCKFVPNNPDIVAMKQISRAFGTCVWKKAIVVLTCADAVEVMNPIMRTMKFREKVKFFKELVNDFTTGIHSTLKSGINVPEDIVEELKVVPTGHSSVSRLVDGTLWFSNFWMECLTAIQSREARMAMLRLNVTRFRQESKVGEGDFEQDLEDQPIVLFKKKNDDTTKKMVLTAGGTLGAGVLGGCIGIIGLIGGPIGAISIPVGFFVGLTIGAWVTSLVQEKDLT